MKLDILSSDTTVETQKMEPGLKLLIFSSPGEIIFDLTWPMFDIDGQWYPLKQFDNTIHPDWVGPVSISPHRSAPVVSYYNRQGENRLTVAHDGLTAITELGAGVHEEDGTLRVRISAKLDALTVRIDERPIEYQNAIREVVNWWQRGISNYPSVPSQRGTVFSTWYAYHQDISQVILEKLIPDLVELGIHTIILDDGWQTDDNHRGYAYTGDWDVAKSKFPDFGKLVSELHENGIKLVVWFSVPYVGMASRRWQEVTGRMLYELPEERCGVLDIRFQSVIDELIGQYLEFIDKYHVDGLKLDFIDAFRQASTSPVFDRGKMQYVTVEDGLLTLLSSLKEQVLQRNPNFFIEFRQSYIGPLMRQFANAFRVADCPYSAQTNHVEICDLRLLSGNTPVHSDMIMWHPDERPEAVALQLQATLFGVLQLSVPPARMTKNQRQVVQRHLSLIRKYQDVLQEGYLRPTHPELNYPMVYATMDDTTFVQLSGGDYPVALNTKHVVICNSSTTKSTRVICNPLAEYQVTITDCSGHLTRRMHLINQHEATLLQEVAGITTIDIL
ncbi:glycoside hydrolase family 36 protein [Lacticaseibacillus nasuensis]|nr:glycoside hydrolase family 36 protein [Lacticaseibacillus nasuensis]